MQTRSTEVAIIGGGLAGILAALRLSKNKTDWLLIDNSLPESNGNLGGFAAFSGAKFSLPPAGLGLVSTAGDIHRLNTKISEVLIELGLPFGELHNSFDNSYLGTKSPNYLRKYLSLLLSPSEIQELIKRLTSELSRHSKVISGLCIDLKPEDYGWNFGVKSFNSNLDYFIQANAVFYAGGRLGTSLLANAGAVPTQGKGLDIGVRIETLNRSAFAALRNLGPDAKIINGACRTFCLNVPGLIYYYPFDDLLIPGGIVAEAEENLANVGLLVRVQDKEIKLRSIVAAAKKSDLMNMNEIVLSGSPHGHLERYGSNILGSDVVSELQNFCKILNDESLVDWSTPYKIHMPLLDWHWDTYAKAGSHKTSLKNIYVIGDSSGHARGLLQAAVGGWIAAEEYLNEEI